MGRPFLRAVWAARPPSQQETRIRVQLTPCFPLPYFCADRYLGSRFGRTETQNGSSSAEESRRDQGYGPGSDVGA